MSAEAPATAAPTYVTLVRRKYVPPGLSGPRRASPDRRPGRARAHGRRAGKVTDVEVKSAKPRDTFEKAAIAAAQKWEYQPAEVDGKPVEARTLVAIDFSLE